MSMRAQSSEVTKNSRSPTKKWIDLGFLVTPVQGSDSIRVGNHDGYGACPTYRVPTYSTATDDWISFSSFPFCRALGASLRSWLTPMARMLVTVSKAFAHGGPIWYSPDLNLIRCSNWQHAPHIYGAHVTRWNRHPRKIGFRSSSLASGLHIPRQPLASDHRFGLSHSPRQD